MATSVQNDTVRDNGPQFELRDYWSIFLRRRRHFALPFAGVFVIAFALAYLLPATYRSEVTILVERQAIPRDLVDTTVQGYVQEQIQQTRQEIVTHENLLAIAEEHGLYPELLKDNPGKLVAEMTENIEVEMIDVDATSPDQSGQRVATIAFIVAFSASTPEAAQAVTNDLAKRYLDEHKSTREAQAAEVSLFLDDEAQKLLVEIDALEKKLATFKQEELRQLPELMDMNLKLYEKTEDDIENSERIVRELNERIDAVRAELSLTEPYREVRTEEGNVMLNAGERLSYLTAEYLRATARYSSEHPDVVRLAREIRQLAGESGKGARADELMGELVTMQEQLRQVRQKYSPDHPEVVRLEKSVASIARSFETAVASGGGTRAAPSLPPDNPRYVALKTQLDSTEANVRAEREKLVGLHAKLDEYDTRLFETPAVDRDYKSLSRDYQNKVQKYSDLQAKQMEARLAQQLEAGSSAEQFRLLGGAYLPSSPTSPNRLGILLLGGLLAFGAGLGGVAFGEYMDQTVRSTRAIVNIMGSEPLAVIPLMTPA